MHRQLGKHQAQHGGRWTDQFVQRRPVFQMHHGNDDKLKLPPLAATAGGVGGKWNVSNPTCVFLCLLSVVNINSKRVWASWEFLTV